MKEKQTGWDILSKQPDSGLIYISWHAQVKKKMIGEINQTWDNHLAAGDWLNLIKIQGTISPVAT